MVSVFLSNLGFYELNSDKNLLDQASHSSSPTKILDFSHYISSPLLNEYMVILVHTMFFGTLLYFTLSLISYLFFFKFNKQKFLPNLETGEFKIMHDIRWSLTNIWVEAFLVSFIRMAIPRYSFIYYNTSDWPIWIIPISLILHIIWDETLTYWVHRFLHTYKFLYMKLHIIHHRSISITPFAGFAFHPFDAFSQALPTFTSCFFFPLHYNIFLVFSVMTSCWAINIHDNVPAMPCKLFLYATHHTIHHERGSGSFKNYGKFTSVWDRLMGSYEDPDRINYGWTSTTMENFFSRFNSFLSRTLDNKLNKKKD